MPWFRASRRLVLIVSRIRVTVSPGADRNEILGRHGDGWKVRVAAPAEGGRANQALVQLLADALALPRDRVRIVSGHASRRKLVEVADLEAEEVGRRLEAAALSQR
jgi:uncharacterized protein (TIGR00251 family)